MPEINKQVAIKLLTSQDVYDTISPQLEMLIDKSSGKMPTIFDVMAAIGVSEGEIEYVESFGLDELIGD